MFKKKYTTMSFAENFLGGHFNIGPVTIYGDNAMHWGVNISSKKFGHICFRLPFFSHRAWWPLYFYCSPNATPWAATFMIGKKYGGRDYRLVPIRRKKLGHNFDTHTQANRDTLSEINNLI